MKRRMTGMLAAALLAQGALGQTWTNLSGGAFTTAGNWNPSTVPGPGNTANINQRGGPYTVFLDTAVTNATVNIGGTAGVAGLATDITLDLSGGGALATTAAFKANNAGGTPNRVTFKNGKLDLTYAGARGVSFGETSPNNTFVLTNMAVNIYCPGTAADDAFAFNSSNNRLELTGGSSWFRDAQNTSSAVGFYCVGANSANIAANNLFLVSGTNTTAVFSDKIRVIMSAAGSAATVEGNELRVEDGALMICSNKLLVAQGGVTRDNLVRVTGEGTQFVVRGTSGNAGGGGVDFGSSSAEGSSNNTFRADSGAHVFITTAAANQFGVTVGGGSSTHNTMQMDSGATLEMDGTYANRVGIGQLGANNLLPPHGNNAWIFDNAFFKGNNTAIVIGGNYTHHNSLVVRNGSAFTNLTDTTAVNFTIGDGRSVGNTVLVADSDFYHGGELRIGAGTTGVDAPLPEQAKMIVSNSTVVIGGAVTFGYNTQTWSNLLEVAAGSKFTCGNVTVGRSAPGENTLRVTGPNSVMQCGTISVNNRALVEVLDGGELIPAQMNVSSSDNTLRIDNGILSANPSLNLNISTLGRLEVAGAESDIRVNQLELRADSHTEFFIGGDGIAPVFCGTRVVNAAARLKVNVSRHPGGVTLPLIVNTTPANGTTQQFAEGMYDIPEGCELVQDSNGISIRIPFRGKTLLILR